MASYKTYLQEYTQKFHLAMPLYESVNEGFDHLPNFKCSVTVNGSRYESSGVHTHKKNAEQSAAQAAIQDLAIKPSEYKFEEAIGKKLLTELLVRMGRGSPTFSFTKTGVDHSPDFMSTVTIDGASYVGGVAKSKKEAETKASFVAFQAIKEQVGDPCFQFQLQAESRVSHELKQSPEGCKDSKSELKTITNGCTPNSEFLVGTNSKQVENSLEMLIRDNEHAVKKGPGKSNASDENSAPSIEPHNQLKQETSLIQPEQEESEVNKQGEFLVGTNSKQVENSLEMLSRDNEHAVEKGPGKSNASDENSAPSIEPHNQLKQETSLIQPEREESEVKKQGVQEVNLKDSINKRSRSESENYEQISGKKQK